MHFRKITGESRSYFVPVKQFAIGKALKLIVHFEWQLISFRIEYSLIVSISWLGISK